MTLAAINRNVCEGRARCPQRAAAISRRLISPRSAEDSRPYLLRGFTLIEMMVAIAVFAIVLASINGIFFGALRLRNRTVESIDNAVPRERALAIIRNDLENIVPPGGQFLTMFTTTGTTTNANGAATAVMPGQSTPEFTTSNGVIDDNTYWGDIQRVSYQLMNSADGGAGRDLVRIVNRNLLPGTQVVTSDQQPILTGVQSIILSYHDGTVWKGVWDSTNEVLRLPRAIKVEIQMAGDGRSRVVPPPLELVVPLVDGGTNLTQVATQ